ncbi:MAG: type II toxin-antitoxin system VapC family toxin [Actinobacteria bacterium]|nr:type II toxin-antitoxin system VapC family toxin [Actinomycetota bacterium]
MILLDTNVISELMRHRPDQAVIRWVDAQPGYRLYISAVTRAEIELGIELLPKGRRRQALQTAATRMFGEFHGRCLAFDEPAASRYAELVAARTRAGPPISVEDAQIAAMALTAGFVLATRNVDDFEEIEGLTVADPWVSAPDI